MAQICCPKCGSDQITANKKGFSGGKALAGAALTGGIGLLAGTAGSNKIKITCLSCGKEFRPGQGGDGRTAKRRTSETEGMIMLIVFLILVWYIFF